MKRLLLCSAVLTLFSISMILFQFSCKKDAGAQRTNANAVSAAAVKVCDVRGVYTGTSRASNGATGALTYELRDNNFAVGSTTLGSIPTTFGGYSNSCDSVYISVHFDDNDSYYLLRGRLKNHDSVISGNFKNLTIQGDHGTFSIRKQ